MPCSFVRSTDSFQSVLTLVAGSYFYTSAELAVRLSFFWVSLNIARVLSALLAAGILQMRGLAGGRPGWWFLFLLGEYLCRMGSAELT